MAEYNALNPIRTVDGAYIPIPSSYKPDASDVSESNAGRTEDTKMHKLMLGTCDHIGLSWAYLDSDAAQEIMAAFAPQYFSLEYLNVRNGSYRTSEFYCGDKNIEMVQTPIGARWNISFNVIERTAH